MMAFGVGISALDMNPVNNQTQNWLDFVDHESCQRACIVSIHNHLPPKFKGAEHCGKYVLRGTDPRPDS
jgi:hypothetical protein